MARDLVTGKLLEFGLDFAREADARALLVSTEVFDDEAELGSFVDRAGGVDLVLVTQQERKALPDGLETINVPEFKLTRTGQIKVAIVLGLSQGLFQQQDRLVCLSGIAGTGVLDTMMFIEVGEEFEMLASIGAEKLSSRVRTDVLDKVLDIAISLGTEGREGKPVGTAFVVGDTEAVLDHAEQLILNPFRGYSEQERNLLLPDVEETVKELSTIDGAFLVREDGIVESAGIFLRTEARNVEIPRGLGARHKSAAAITALTDALAVTVSESSGNVTVLQDGKVVVEIEKPRPIGRETALRRQFFGKQTPGVDTAANVGAES